jgi:t-SNARE complex subunit (syntaxin)
MRTNPKSDRLQPYKAQYMRLCKLYVDAMKEHQKSKENMRKVQTEDLVRRGMIIYGEGKTEGEIREKVEKDPANFVRDALMEEAADEAQQAYVEAQSRARDVEMLVRSLNEVAAMFQDLAVLVQHQSEMLDSIEENVESATTYIKKGNQAVRFAADRDGVILTSRFPPPSPLSPPHASFSPTRTRSPSRRCATPSRRRRRRGSAGAASSLS